MPVLDVLFTKIEAHRNPQDKDVDISKGVKVSSGTKINNVSKEKYGSVGECLFVDFTYTVGYEPDIGGMLVEGKVIYYAKKLTQVCDNKDGTIVLKPDAFEMVQNSILGSSTIQSLFMARDMKLPPSISLPKVQMRPATEQVSGNGDQVSEESEKVEVSETDTEESTAD